MRRRLLRNVARALVVSVGANPLLHLINLLPSVLGKPMQQGWREPYSAASGMVNHPTTIPPQMTYSNIPQPPDANMNLVPWYYPGMIFGGFMPTPAGGNPARTHELMPNPPIQMPPMGYQTNFAHQWHPGPDGQTAPQMGHVPNFPGDWHPGSGGYIASQIGHRPIPNFAHHRHPGPGGNMAPQMGHVPSFPGGIAPQIGHQPNFPSNWHPAPGGNVAHGHFPGNTFSRPGRETQSTGSGNFNQVNRGKTQIWRNKDLSSGKGSQQGPLESATAPMSNRKATETLGISRELSNMEIPDTAMIIERREKLKPQCTSLAEHEIKKINDKLIMLAQGAPEASHGASKESQVEKGTNPNGIQKILGSAEKESEPPLKELSEMEKFPTASQGQIKSQEFPEVAKVSKAVEELLREVNNYVHISSQTSSAEFHVNPNASKEDSKDWEAITGGPKASKLSGNSDKTEAKTKDKAIASKVENSQSVLTSIPEFKKGVKNSFENDKKKKATKSNSKAAVSIEEIPGTSNNQIKELHADSISYTEDYSLHRNLEGNSNDSQDNIKNLEVKVEDPHSNKEEKLIQGKR
ncbi:hypothetical protein PtA15_2A847 [Puccinia triticina]|uniref:Uncharacterized protein n=1 Tax=Puccinia triticina TaxID=208348 RepID=A0ABY7CCP1_9BASI|nr:uncharacterized protein PtA15_2A847 [Puccinia triticina]WAQ82530.1 hypothetical protein PtA15_2A847 [Puccinia triticina]